MPRPSRRRRSILTSLGFVLQPVRWTPKLAVSKPRAAASTWRKHVYGTLAAVSRRGLETPHATADREPHARAAEHSKILHARVAEACVTLMATTVALSRFALPHHPRFGSSCRVAVVFESGYGASAGIRMCLFRSALGTESRPAQLPANTQPRLVPAPSQSLFPPDPKVITADIPRATPWACTRAASPCTELYNKVLGTLILGARMLPCDLETLHRAVLRSKRSSNG